MEDDERLNEDVFLKALEALKKASREIETNPEIVYGGGGGGGGGYDNWHLPPSVKALLELETGSEDLLAGDPQLSTLSQLLHHLKALVSSIRSSVDEPNDKGGGRRLLGSLLRRWSRSSQEISRTARSIGAEIQSWIDRQSTDRLVSALRTPAASPAEVEERAELLAALEARVSQGFDPGLQEVLLRLGAFVAVESALADPAAPKRVRERAAAAALALVRFNKAVFVGPVLMGPTVGALVGMPASPPALCALRGLVSAIRSPLIDELLACGHIPRLVGLLSTDCALGNGESHHLSRPPPPPFEVQLAALECALEIGYYGRKEAIEAMVAEGVVKWLVELQRSELGGALIEMDEAWAGDYGDGGVEAGRRRRWWRGDKERRFLEARPFASCVARWAIQVDVGEGLRQREKRAMKREIVEQVRRAAVDQAEAATVLAEVLWGPTIWT